MIPTQKMMTNAHSAFSKPRSIAHTASTAPLRTITPATMNIRRAAVFRRVPVAFRIWRQLEEFPRLSEPDNRDPEPSESELR
jgi:hypothetical protein